MSETLIIRLASDPLQKQHWLIWSETEKEIIASGEIESAEKLNTLTDKALSRSVVCLLPGVDVCIREVPIAGKYNRQIQQALPYLIEEELAGDVDKLHFTVVAKQTDLLHVAVCDKQRMVAWLAWLEDAQITCKQFIPEGLALPLPSDRSWQAVQLDNHWIIRESEALAWSCEAPMLDAILVGKISDDTPQTIECYSPISDQHRGDWVNDFPTLPMELLGTGVIGNKINLLSGEFKIKNELNKEFLKWSLPAILVTLLFVVSCLNLLMKNYQVEAEITLVKEQTERVYQLAFPDQTKLKYSRIRRNLNTQIENLDGQSDSTSFVMMLNDLAPVFKANKALIPSNLKYDASKKELRISAVADNFQDFEKFSSMVPEKFTLDQGTLNSSKSKVSGLLTIREQ